MKLYSFVHFYFIFFFLVGGPIIMASYALQQLRSEQQSKQLVRISRLLHHDQTHHELKRTKKRDLNILQHQNIQHCSSSSSGSNQRQQKRETKYTRGEGNKSSVVDEKLRLSLTGPRLGYNSLTIWFQVLLIVCLCHYEVFGEGNVGKCI